MLHLCCSRRSWAFCVPLAMLTLLGSATSLTAQGELDAWLARLTNEDADVRQAAWEEATRYGPEAIVPLGRIIATADRPVARAARLAMEAIVYEASGYEVGDTRFEASRALCGLLETDQPGTVRATEIRLLGMIGRDEAVDTLVHLLDDPDLGEDARQALERIPTGGAGEALLAALERVEVARKPGFMLALANRGERAAVPELVEFTQHGNVEVRIAALEGLGRLGDLAGADPARQALGAEDARERRAAADALLRLAEANQDQPDPARRMYERVLRSGPHTAARVAAVAGLEKLSDPASLDGMLQSLGDPDPVFHQAALALIDRVASGDVLSLMREAYETAGADARAGLLLGMASRDDGTVAPTLLEALGDADNHVKAAAATGLGTIMHQEAAPALLSVAETGEDPAQSAALSSYLTLLTARLAERREQALLPLLNHALEIATEDTQRRVALEGIAAFGDPSSLPLVEPLTTQDGTRPAALQAYVAIGRTLAEQDKKQEAAEVFRTAVARGAPPELANECARQLRDLGIEVNLAKEAGFVTDWWLIDHFPHQDRKGFDEIFPPEAEVDLEKGVTVHGQAQEWTPYHTDDVQGIVPLERLLKPNTDRVAYAYAVISVGTEQDVTLKIGSDDAVKCWVNGELVHANNTYRPVRVDEDKAAGHFRAGDNEILLKIVQGGGGWGFCLRLVGEDGNALRFEQKSPR